ncbi:MAG: ABC transporter ATP-binding protein [Verrucomicrobiota bacterium]
MIRTENLTKQYANDFVALDNLNLEIRKGEIFGYVGPNGAGKTTTIRMLCGLLKPTSGSAVIGEHDISGNVRQLRRLTGYLPDRFGVYEEMRVWEYLDFFGACFRIPRRKRRERIEQVLNITKSEAMRDYFVDTLSHGMRQRIGIAKTLMHDPQVLFLDEPTNGLDPRARIEMRSLIKELAALGKTILVSSHILPELASVCDRVGILEQGVMLAQGTIEEIMKQVNPHRLVELQFAGDDSPVRELSETLEKDGEIENARLQDDILQFEIRGDDQQMAGLLRRFIDADVAVTRYQEEQADLEKAFLRVTDGAAAGARRQGGGEQ